MRVLVIRLSSIGDVILTTPILKKLKETYPDIVVDFVVMKQFKDAIEGSSYIDNLYLFDKNKDDGLRNMIAFGKELKKNNYDIVYDLHSKLRSKVISKTIGSKVYTYKKREFIKTILVKARVIKYKVTNTIVKNYFGAFKNINLEYSGEDLDFPYSDKDIKTLEDKIMLEEDFVVIAPGASKETKKWTQEGFGKLIKLIDSRYNKKVMIIGSKQEYEMCENIKNLSGNIAVNLAGELTLKESGALLSKASFLVTNDSGPFHIARGVKCKTFVIFGPTSPDMFEYDKDNILIYGKESCSPCSLHGDKRCPKGHFNCMKNITAEKIIKVIDENWRIKWQKN